MKATVLSIAALSLFQLASAQPAKRHERHAHRHAKRDAVTVTDIVYAAATNEPQVVVYVDQNGKPVSTTTNAAAPAVAFSTSRPVVAAPSKLPSSVAPVVAAVVPTTSSKPAPAPTTSVAPVVVSSSSSAAPATSSTASTPAAGNGMGLTYSPYNSDGTCKSASAVLQDFKGFGSGYSFIRTYGTDCDTVATVLAACRANGLKLWAGIFSLSGIAGQVGAITSAFKGDYSDLYAVSVGNELVNGGVDAGAVLAAVAAASTLLKVAGFTGPVVTVDTLVATRSNPSLCAGQPFCAVNCHPFFDGNTVASDSGSFLKTQIASLQSSLSDKNQKILIMETGWPFQGQTNGKAVPSKENQAAALSSIKEAFSSNPEAITLFNPYNMHWKTSSASQFDAEPYWGFLGDSPSG